MSDEWWGGFEVLEVRDRVGKSDGFRDVSRNRRTIAKLVISGRICLGISTISRGWGGLECFFMDRSRREGPLANLW